jgi:hypothetical protein
MNEGVWLFALLSGQSSACGPSYELAIDASKILAATRFFWKLLKKT